MSEITDIKDKAQLALENGQKAMANLKEATENNELAIKRAQRAADYQDVVNAYTAHAYYYRGQMQPEEMDIFWVRNRHDVTYNIYAGREALNNYYLESTSEFKSTKIRMFHDWYPEYPLENKRENYGVGDLVLMHQTTPYVEIAGNGQTAQGYWRDSGLTAELQGDGMPAGMIGVNTGCGGDLMKEDGRWKIWHFIAGVSAEGGVDLPLNFKYLLPHEAAPNHDIGMKLGGNVELQMKGSQFSPVSIPRNEPELPLPYDTWDDSRSYVKEKSVPCAAMEEMGGAE